MLFMYYPSTTSHPCEIRLIMPFYIWRTCGLEKWNNSPNTIELVSRIQPGFEYGQGDNLFAVLSIITIVPLTSMFILLVHQIDNFSHCIFLVYFCLVLLELEDLGYLIERRQHLDHDWDRRWVELEAGLLHKTGEFLLWSVPHMLSCTHVQAWG